MNGHSDSLPLGIPVDAVTPPLPHELKACAFQRCDDIGRCPAGRSATHTVTSTEVRLTDSAVDTSSPQANRSST